MPLEAGDRLAVVRGTSARRLHLERAARREVRIVVDAMRRDHVSLEEFRAACGGHLPHPCVQAEEGLGLGSRQVELIREVLLVACAACARTRGRAQLAHVVAACRAQGR